MNKSTSAVSRWAACLCLLSLGLLTACNSSGGDGGSAAPGAASVSLTDAPACGYDEVNVTVSKVRIHQSSSADDTAAGWSEITLNPPRKINLLDFNDPTMPVHVQPLGVTALGAGHYTQLRLVLVENKGGGAPANSVVLSGTTAEIPLDTPSAIQSGIKLVHEFTVNSGQTVDLLLDFDACKSIVVTGSGNYKLKPVIKVIPVELNGIRGVMDKTLTNVRVSAQQGGTVVRETVMNAATGEFFLAHLDPGHYDVVMTADNRATGVVAGVPVASTTSTTTISDSGAPLTLPASATQAIHGTVTVSPADDEGTVLVAARQSLGPTVVVKSQVASLIAGNPPGDYFYTLNLPIAAPVLAPYGPLPLPLSAQLSAEKLYTVKGSAQTDTAVYATQTPAPSVKDITVVVNQTQDLTLTSP
jgi:hypothetical protein